MPASTFVGNNLLDLMCRGVAWPPPATVYVSLHTADPGYTGASEVQTASWPAYVRKNAAGAGALADAFSPASAKATTNAHELLWPAMDGAGTITLTHYGLWDAATGGNFLQGGPLAASKTLGPTDEIVLHEGALNIGVT